MEQNIETKNNKREMSDKDMAENTKETFRYTYSPKNYEEVRQIREKYLPKKEDKIERLRRLDASATKKGRIISIILGVIGTMLLGIGMCCTMVWTEKFFILGIIVGVIGMIMMAIVYPIYARITKKERERIAPEILKLTDEIMSQNSKNQC